MKILLVAGHALGGDPGAVYGNLKENWENVQITDKVYDILKRHGVDVLKDSHTNDMYDSLKWVNSHVGKLDDGFVIDIHKNSHTSAATGVETWIMHNSDNKTISFANKVQWHLANETGLRNRGVKNKNFYVITYAKCRGVLVECGFINHDPTDDDWDSKYALGIARGVLEYLGIPYSVPTPPAPVDPPKPKVNWVDMGHPRTLLAAKDLRIYRLPELTVVGDTIVAGKPIEFAQECEFGGVAYLRTRYSTEKGLDNGIRLDELKELPPTPTEPPKTDDPEPVVPDDEVPDYAKENHAMLKWLVGLVKSLLDWIKGVK